MTDPSEQPSAAERATEAQPEAFLDLSTAAHATGDVEMSQEDSAAIAAIIAEDIAAMDGGDDVDVDIPEIVQGEETVQTMVAPPAVTAEALDNTVMEGVQAASASQDPASAQEDLPVPPIEGAAQAPLEPSPQQPTPHIYIFVQIFDPQFQSLITLRGHLAKREEKVTEAVRKVLPWPADQDVHIWERVGAFGTISIGSASTFDDVESLTDGSIVIAAKKLSDKEYVFQPLGHTESRLISTSVSTLQSAGKFSKLYDFLRYQWLSRRKHPTDAYTGEITMSTFGEPYFKGSLHKGLRHGQGTSVSDSGTHYTGSFLLGNRSGTGTMIHQNGDMYTGDWENDECNGQGTFIQKRTGNQYVGGYKDGRRFGKGVSYWEVADEEMKMCQICYDKEMDALFYDCGHVCACVECAKQVDCCPICRKSVVAVVRIFKT